MNKMKIWLTGCILLLSPVLLEAAPYQFPRITKDSVTPYEAVIPADAVSSKGFITVHKVKERYLFEIPDTILDRDLYTVNRITKSPQDWRHPMGGLCSFGSDWIGQALFRLSKSGDDKVLLRVISSTERSDTGYNSIEDAVMNNNVLPVYASFPVKTLGKDRKSVVLDMTDFIGSDNAVFGYMAGLKTLAMPVPPFPDRSFINNVRAYPLNVEIATTRTYGQTGSSVTAEYNSSIVLLPKEPMRGRDFDERVGYLAVLTDYNQMNANGVMSKRSAIWRWRLEPKPEDREKYFKGELVEPEKPIIFYIDPETPEKWVPYLVAGVSDWQKAFEKAGFKNAVMAREVDPADTSFDLNDARHNVIVYKASAIGNAMGHSLQDPRTGEMIESHIQWYHSVMEVLYTWYFTQAGAVDTAAQQPCFSDTLMGQLIRFVSSHEIGHALGLRHNWGASSTSTIAQLRDRKWVEMHGHTPSIMDYARFNYVAQPEDSIGPAGIFPRIGDYDEWAIEWGYRLLPPGTDAEAEKRLLNQWIVDKLRQSDRFRFGIGDDPSAKYPDNQREDLGDDAMEAGTWGIRNLQRIRPNLVKWVLEPVSTYDRIEKLYKALVAQYEWYIKHVIANVGGVHFTPRTLEQDGPVFRHFSREKQQRAVAFLQRELFNTPEWLKDDFIYNRTNVDFSLVENLQRNAIKQLLDPRVFNKLRSQEMADPATAYSTRDLLSDLADGIFAELKTGVPVSANRRMVQHAYVNELIALLELPSNAIDAGALLRAQGRELMALCKRQHSADKYTKAHVESIYEVLFEKIEEPLQHAGHR